MTAILAEHLPSLFGPGRRPAWRRTVARRLLALACVALALSTVLGEVGPGPTRRVVVATAPTGAGEPVTQGAVRLEERPAAELPDAALTALDQVVGLMSTVDVAAGEVFTGARVLGRDRAVAGPSRRLVSVPLALSSPGVSVGDRVDVFVPGSSTAVATGGQVAALPASEDQGSLTEPTAVLSLRPEDAAAVIGALDADRAVGLVLIAHHVPSDAA
ncbi:hypothetical protein GCM10022199_10810 [Marihabitans asiaticum]|uniref:SAF domain-containing protein n=1 Tax=Marihabitans asiaticum TaxID=415218 RepID=A0A560WHM9_9MICO|nr:SAF domain-containing protein [Marihabitans asiaticum]TWD17098.1 SAF domain-containing protein [Marihabitans asiaticum]